MDTRIGRRKRQLQEAAAVGDMGGPQGRDGSELGDEVLEPDTKVERFFELMERIRDMKESWARARNSHNNIAAPAPPPAWTPRFCWVDFAPAAAAATRQVSPTVAAVAAGHEEDQGDAEAIVIDGNHNGRSAVTLDQPQVGGVVLAGNGGGQSSQGNSKANAAMVGPRGTRGLPSVRLVDHRSGGVDSESAGPGGGGGKVSTNAAAGCSLELKLALW